MKGRGGVKRRGAWLRFSCFSRPVGDSCDSEERRNAGSKVNYSTLGAKKAIFKGEQGPPGLSCDSPSRLEAYLGRGQQALHGASDSVLSQAAHTAATERRLKGLADDQVSCSSNAAPCSSSQVDSVASSDALPESGAASSFKSSSPIKAPHMESNTPQHPQKIDSALLQKGKEEGGALLVPGSSNEYQLHAAPATPSKLLNRISGPVTPPDDSETSKMHPHDATPTASDSDRSQDSILQLADRPTWASAISTSVSAPGYPNQLTATPFDSIFHPRHALIPSRSSHSLASVADSMFTEGSVKLEAIAPAPSNHTPIRTISITLSSITLDTLAHSVDGDAASFTSATGRPQPPYVQGKHQRSKTMPHMHLDSQDFLLLDDKSNAEDAVSVKSVHSQHTRRHTAIVLLSNSEDENEDENNEMESDGAGEEAAASSSSDPSVTSSMMSSRGSRSMRRRLSDVYEGHHIPLQKLRKQMGNPEDPPGDLLSLMARRVFSQQGIMSRVNSEGLISILDAQSSFNTPSNQDRQDSRVENSNSDWLETRISSLPRIRTQLGVSESAHSVGMV
ncbi:hypothetical protein Ndes2526B_g07125 [Nannochloris sp. 'desiccata']